MQEKYFLFAYEKINILHRMKIMNRSHPNKTRKMVVGTI
jgi:hypothetical protein